MGLINLISLFVYALLNVFYLSELFWGGWSLATTKGFYYAITALFLLYLFISDAIGYEDGKHYQINIISKFTVVAIFATYGLVQLNILPKPVYYLFLLCGSIVVTNLIILISSARHGYFKN